MAGLDGYPLTAILPTDTFKEWADKCNDIITGIENTTFVTGDDYLRAGVAATITANWNFSGNFNINNPGKTTTIQGTGGLTVSKNTTFTAEKLLTFQQTASKQLVFTKDGHTNSIGYGASPTATGPLCTTAHWEAPKLISSTGALQLNGVDYTWFSGPIPSNNPGAKPSYFTVDQSGTVAIQTKADLESDIIAAAVAALSDANFVLPVELIPVGTHLYVDRDVVIDHFPSTGPETYGESTKYPTWRVMDGSAVSFDENASPVDDRYKELCILLNPALSDGDSTGSANLPNLAETANDSPYVDGFYLIKAEPDTASNFTVTGQPGISITPAGPNAGGLGNAFDIYGGDIALDTDANDFQYSGNTLQIKSSTTATADSIAKRNNDGTLEGADPTADEHLATKSYVDDISAGSGSSTFALNGGGTFSHVSNSDYTDAYQNMWATGINNRDDLSIVDKKRTVRYFGHPSAGANTNDYRKWKGENNNQGAGHAGRKLPFNTVGSTKSLGDYAQNAKHVVNWRWTQMVIDEDNIPYIIGSNKEGVIGKALTTDVHTGDWFNAGEFDSSHTTSWLPGMVPTTWPTDNIIIDWFATTRNRDDNEFHLIIKTEDDDIAETYGKLISAGDGNRGQFGNGTTSNTDETGGPLIWGPTGPWATLWRHYATDSANQATTFHYHTDTGTYPNEWYISKVWIFNRSVFVLVQQNSDTTGANSELWAAGSNGFGQLGRGDLENNDTAIYPIPIHRNNTTAVTVNSSEDSNKVYVSNSPHNLKDWSILTHDGNDYYVRLGDRTIDSNTGQGNNPTTKFRLFQNEGDAYSGTSGGEANGLSLAIAFNVHSQLIGIDQLAAYSNNNNNLTVVGLTTNNAVLGWGENQFGGTGLSNTSNTIKFARESISAGGSPAGASGGKVIAVIGGGESAGQGILGGYSDHHNNFLIYEITATGRRVLYGCGDSASGRLNVSQSSGLLRTWQKLSQDNESVDKVFVDGFGRGIWYVGVPTSGPNVLKVAGSSQNGYLGIGTGDATIVTKEFVTVPFSEDPMNIVSMVSSHESVIALCKNNQDPGANPPDLNGRLYITGQSRGGIYFRMLQDVSGDQTTSYFEKIDNIVNV